MPTTIWIIEAAEDRYWEGAPAASVSPSFSCPYCEATFTSPDSLEDHIRSFHFLDLPALLLCGEHLAGESIIRTESQESDIRLVNCTKVQVRKDAGEPRFLTAREFCLLFARQRYAHWLVTLVNSRTPRGPYSEREYRLEFRIPTRTELNEIDRRFIRYLAVDHPRHADIQLFTEESAPIPTAREYIGALADYALGVMIKEQGEALVAPLGFEEYRVKFLAARTVLREFHRPVAEAITSCIDFNLNGFTGSEVPSRLQALAAAHGLFRAVAHATQPIMQIPAGAARFGAAICPTDTVTDALLSVSERYMRGARVGVDTAEGLLRFEEAKAISEYDKPKIHVLCGLCYLKARKWAHAADQLRQVQFDSLFGEWANRRLEELQ